LQEYAVRTADDSVETKGRDVADNRRQDRALSPSPGERHRQFEEENAAWDRRIRALLDELRRVTQEIGGPAQTKRRPFWGSRTPSWGSRSTIMIGALTFDHAEYDADGDVLDLSVGEPRLPSDLSGTPEGHIVRYGDDGNVIGLALVNVRWLLERDGEVKVTIPSCVRAEALAPALAAAAASSG
jgi:hypothetical protein